ncbi:MAG: hypothetical protein QW273_00350 [Candidatus Pacearchaeota archaeon]
MKLSEEEKRAVEEEAKSLLEEFGKKLTNLSFEEDSSFSQEGREEGFLSSNNEDFRFFFFFNAPFKDENFIYAEKGEWK